MSGSTPGQPAPVRLPERSRGTSRSVMQPRLLEVAERARVAEAGLSGPHVRGRGCASAGRPRTPRPNPVVAGERRSPDPARASISEQRSRWTSGCTSNHHSSRGRPSGASSDHPCTVRSGSTPCSRLVGGLPTESGQAGSTLSKLVTRSQRYPGGTSRRNHLDRSEAR